MLLCFNIKILKFSRIMLIGNIISLIEFILEIIYVIFFISLGQDQLAKLCRVNMKSFKNLTVLSKESWNKMYFSSIDIPRG